MKNNSDESITERDRQYSEFVTLLSRHDLAIRRFIRYLLPSSEGIDDVMQETALECWKKYGDFESKSADDTANEFIRWACVIARFKVLSWQRDRSRDRLVFREDVIEQIAQMASESLLDLEAEREAVEDCLEKLPARLRQLVLSIHTPGESIAGIAKETGIKARQLYSKVNQLRKKILGCVKLQLAGESSNG